jgi:hypothetical protein
MDRCMVHLERWGEDSYGDSIAGLNYGRIEDFITGFLSHFPLFREFGILIASIYESIS